MIHSSATCAQITSPAPIADAHRLPARMTADEFWERLRDQGVTLEHHAFRCPSCGNIQSRASMTHRDPITPLKYLVYHCENALRLGCPGWNSRRGLVLVQSGGDEHLVFPPATPGEARELARKMGVIND